MFLHHFTDEAPERLKTCLESPGLWGQSWGLNLTPKSMLFLEWHCPHGAVVSSIRIRDSVSESIVISTQVRPGWVSLLYKMFSWNIASADSEGTAGNSDRHCHTEGWVYNLCFFPPQEHKCKVRLVSVYAERYMAFCTHPLSHFICIVTLGDKNYYLHFIDKKTESQEFKSLAQGPRVQNYQARLAPAVRILTIGPFRPLSYLTYYISSC